MGEYGEFLEQKRQNAGNDGFEPVVMPGDLFDFQVSLVEWATRKGRAAIFADCGMGKTAMQLAWAQNVVQHTNKRVLVLTPLAVSQQTIKEGEKFGIESIRSGNGNPSGDITVTNYERLHLFNPSDYAGVVCDESSILKNFSGARRGEITSFMRKMRYRLLCTATAAPNDTIELGTSSEALGYMGHMDMLNRFFKNETNNSATNRMHGQSAKWRMKSHAEEPFWRWVASWARMIRRPSDLGFDNDGFVLPGLSVFETIVDRKNPPEGMLFALPAINLEEQRAERRETIEERCEAAAGLTASHDSSIAWCHLNPEGDLLERLIPGAVQVSGSDSDEAKEERLMAFAAGEVPVLVTKPRIGAFGLNFQQCAHMTFFPSHSYEQYYQAVRRCWRFGQPRPVSVDLISTEGEQGVLANLQRKADAADKLFDNMVAHMNQALAISAVPYPDNPVEVPKWL